MLFFYIKMYIKDINKNSGHLHFTLQVFCNCSSCIFFGLEWFQGFGSGKNI